MSYECLDCNRTFSSILGAQSHSRAKGHSLPECKECERIFVNENALRNVSNVDVLYLNYVEGQSFSRSISTMHWFIETTALIVIDTSQLVMVMNRYEALTIELNGRLASRYARDVALGFLFCLSS